MSSAGPSVPSELFGFLVYAWLLPRHSPTMFARGVALFEELGFDRELLSAPSLSSSLFKVEASPGMGVLHSERYCGAGSGSASLPVFSPLTDVLSSGCGFCFEGDRAVDLEPSRLAFRVLRLLGVLSSLGDLVDSDAPAPERFVDLCVLLEDELDGTALASLPEPFAGVVEAVLRFSASFSASLAGLVSPVERDRAVSAALVRTVSFALRDGFFGPAVAGVVGSPKDYPVEHAGAADFVPDLVCDVWREAFLAGRSVLERRRLVLDVVAEHVRQPVRFSQVSGLPLPGGVSAGLFGEVVLPVWQQERDRVVSDLLEQMELRLLELLAASEAVVFVRTEYGLSSTFGFEELALFALFPHARGSGCAVLLVPAAGGAHLVWDLGSDAVLFEVGELSRSEVLSRMEVAAGLFDASSAGLSSLGAVWEAASLVGVS